MIRLRVHAAVITIIAGLGSIPAPLSAWAQTADGTAVLSEQDPEALQQALENSRARAAELAGREQALNQELAQIRSTLATNALLLQARENERRTLVDKIGDLETRLTLAQARLKARREELSQLLGGLQRLGRIPPEAILSHAKSVTELSRAATIMGNAVPAVQQALEPLRDEIETVKELRGLIDNRRIELVTLSNTLEQQDKELEALLNDRAERLASTSADHAAEAERVDNLAKRAADLQALMQELARLPDPPNATPNTAPTARTSRLRYLPPISGQITQRFGSHVDGGGRADGLIYHARAGQMVLAPADGTVRYAGPFRRYGRVVIIDHGQEYHSVLAGPLALMAQVGQPVRAGEPIGRLDHSIASSNSLLQSGVSGSNTDELPLYFESRYRGRPQNPLLFVANQTN